MSDTFEVREAWERSRRLAQTAVSEASRRVRDYAKAEADYYAAKAKAALRMKAKGVPATVISATVKGDPEVNRLLYERIAAEGLYRAAMKAIDVYRDDARNTYDEYRRTMTGDNL